MLLDLYKYKAVCTAVYDGDTITLDIDLGFNMIMRNQKIRLYGIDTPELRGDEREQGLKVRDWVREQILNKEVILESIKDKTGKYGRWIGKIWLLDKEGVPYLELNTLLVSEGYAEYVDY